MNLPEAQQTDKERDQLKELSELKDELKAEKETN